MHDGAMFLFLAAGAVGLFAFLSVATWVGTEAHSRKARDRTALLKSIAENPNENALKVLDLLREDEERERLRKQSEERKGYLVGGLATVASGVGLVIMFLALDAKAGVWSVGLIPLLIGVVLTLVGVYMKPVK
jgi:hypothetical protein